MKEKKEKKEKIGFYLHMSKEEREIVTILKNKYCLNISKLIKSFLINKHHELENKNV
jgi:hypothetical protein